MKLDELTSKMVPKHIAIEPAFNEVVRNYGGIVLEEALPYAPDFQNADYVFHSERVIAELKCLTEDNVQSVSNKEKASRIVCEENLKGSVSFTEFNIEHWKQMPNDLQRNLYRIFTAIIRRRVSKANKQIRETREHLGLTDYTGLLFIANDGVTSLNPASFINAVQLALKREFREIRHFVFFTVNMYAKIRNVPMPTLFWISFDMQDGPGIDPLFLESLGNARTASSAPEGYAPKMVPIVIKMGLPEPSNGAQFHEQARAVVRVGGEALRWSP